MNKKKKRISTFTFGVSVRTCMRHTEHWRNNFTGYTLTQRLVVMVKFTFKCSCLPEHKFGSDYVMHM